VAWQTWGGAKALLSRKNPTMPMSIDLNRRKVSSRDASPEKATTISCRGGYDLELSLLLGMSGLV
jgi:hypothetical protein